MIEAIKIIYDQSNIKEMYLNAFDDETEAYLLDLHNYLITNLRNI